MEFWQTFLDPTKHRKIKGFIVACTLAYFGKIDSTAWAIAFSAFITGITYDKITKSKNKE